MNKPESVAVDKLFWKGEQCSWYENLGCTSDISNAGGSGRKVGHFEHMKRRGVLSFIKDSSHSFHTRQDRQCVLHAKSLLSFLMSSTCRLNIFIFSSNKNEYLCKTATSLRLYFNKRAKWWNYFRFSLGSDIRKVFLPAASFSVLVLLNWFGSKFSNAFTAQRQSQPEVAFPTVLHGTFSTSLSITNFSTLC